MYPIGSRRNLAWFPRHPSTGIGAGPEIVLNRNVDVMDARVLPDSSAEWNSHRAPAPVASDCGSPGVLRSSSLVPMTSGAGGPTEVVSRSTSIRNVALPGLFGWLALLSGLSPFLVKIIGGGLFGMQKPWWWEWFPGSALGLAAAALVAAGVAWGRANDAAQSGAPMRVEGDRLVIDRPGAPTAVPLSEIRAGALFPKDQGADVTIDLTRGRLLTASFANSADAEKLLVAAGIDVSQRRYRTRVGSTCGRPFAGFGAFIAIAALGIPRPVRARRRRGSAAPPRRGGRVRGPEGAHGPSPHRGRRDR